MGRDEPADNNSSDSDKKPEQSEGHFPQPDFLKDFKEFLKAKQATQNRLALVIMVSSLLITGVLLFILWPRPEVIVVERETEKVLKEGKKEPIMREVTNKAPTAVIKADKKLAGVPTWVHFDGRGSSDEDGSIDSCHWDFGNGDTSSSCRAKTRYKKTGQYTVVLTVADDRGEKAQDSVVVKMVDSTPRISNLRVFTDWIRAERPKQKVRVSFDYLDRARDVTQGESTVIVEGHSGYYEEVTSKELRAEGDRGTVTASFTIDDVNSSILYFDVQLIDGRGLSSNELNGSVKVRSADHPPRIYNVTIEPSTVPCHTGPGIGSSKEVWISAHYEDEDEDVGPKWDGYFSLMATTPSDDKEYYVDVEIKEGDVVRGSLVLSPFDGDCGEWKVDIRLVDSKGNKSNLVTEYIYARE